MAARAAGDPAPNAHLGLCFDLLSYQRLQAWARRQQNPGGDGAAGGWAALEIRLHGRVVNDVGPGGGRSQTVRWPQQGTEPALRRTL